MRVLNVRLKLTFSCLGYYATRRPPSTFSHRALLRFYISASCCVCAARLVWLPRFGLGFIAVCLSYYVQSKTYWWFIQLRLCWRASEASAEFSAAEEAVWDRPASRQSLHRQRRRPIRANIYRDSFPSLVSRAERTHLTQMLTPDDFCTFSPRCVCASFPLVRFSFVLRSIQITSFRFFTSCGCVHSAIQ